MERATEKHESYAMIGAHRFYDNRGNNMFGSHIKHFNGIAITIKQATRERDLSREWIFGKEALIEVHLSPAQFAEMISSLNMGDGVPCTLRYFNGEEMEPCPDYSVQDRIEDDFKKKVMKINEVMGQAISEATELLSKKGTPTKKELNALLGKLRNIQTEMECNIPFVQSSFTEAMDKTVHEAKTEVEAFITNALINLGRMSACLTGQNVSMPDVSTMMPALPEPAKEEE